MRPALVVGLVAAVASALVAQPDATPTRTFRGHTAGVFNASYSPDGKQVASAGKDRVVRVWDAATGEEVRKLEGHTGEVYRVVYSPDGKLLASAGDQTVRLWDAATGKAVRSLAATATPYNLAFHPDGQRLAASGSDGHVRIWTVADGQLVKAVRAHTERGLGVDFSPDGRLMATAANAGGTAGQGDVYLFDTTTWQQVGQLAGAKGVVLVAFSPSGTTLATGGTDKGVRLWETCTGREVLRFDGHSDSAYFVAFSPDGRRLASCGGNWSADTAAEVIVWDAATAARLATFGGHPAPIWSLAYRPDGHELASACGKWAANTAGEVRLWDLRPVRDEAVPAATADDLRRWWDDLHGDDAGKAYRAGWGLARGGEPTLALMRERVKPLRASAPEMIARWVADLGNDDFDTREAAQVELEKVGSAARSAVTAALTAPDAETRRRAAVILERITEVALSVEQVHALRELDVLARVGPTAKGLVERYAVSPDGTPVGGAARRVLRQLGP